MTPSSWGLKEEFLKEWEEREKKVVVTRLKETLLAIPLWRIREIVRSPQITPFLLQSPLAGVFSLRGEIYAFVDPFFEKKIYPVALLLDIPKRFLSIGVDQILSFQTLTSPPRKRRFPRAKWAKEMVKVEEGPALLFSVESFLEELTHLEEGGPL